MVVLAIPLWTVDLAISDGAFVSGGLTGQWRWDVPTVGPGGGACWGTNPDGPYLHDTVDWLEIPLGDLSGVAQPTLVIHHWYDVLPGDAARVEVDAGAGFVVFDPAGGYPDPAGYVGSSGVYADAVFDLQALGPTPRLRLTLETDLAQAADGWYVDRVELWDGDLLPPVVTPVSVPVDTQDLVGPYSVRMSVVDDATVTSVALWSSVAGAPASSVPMVYGVGAAWLADLPAQPPDTQIDFWVEATDGENVGRWPVVGESSFRVFLAAPTDLTGPTGSRLVDDTVDLTFVAPVSPHPVLAYLVQQEGDPEVTVVTETEASVRLDPEDSQAFSVTAVYEVGTGDPSEVLALDVLVPELLRIEPSAGYQGEAITISLTGASWFLDDASARLDLGTDVRVLSFDVLDADTAVASVEIVSDARKGLVDVDVTGAYGRFSFDDRFEIRDGDEAPRIRRVAPAVVLQGETVGLEVEATVGFSRAPTITVDDDLVVTTEVSVDGATATFGLAVNTRASLGWHDLVLDDGQRLFSTSVRVEEYVEPPRRGCDHAGAAGPIGLVTALLLRRRTRPTATTRRATAR